MKEFDRKVSIPEYSKSAMPSERDISVLAYCLGAIWAMEVPILRCLKATQGVTENARLRFMLAQVIDRMRERSDVIALFSNHPDLLPDQFIELFRESDDSFIYESGIPGIAKKLLDFSRRGGCKPITELAQMIQRPPVTTEVLRCLHRYYQDSQPLTSTLIIAKKECSPGGRACIGRIQRGLSISHSVSNAFFEMKDEYFDEVCMNIVDAAEMDDEVQTQQKLKLAFRLLCEE